MAVGWETLERREVLDCRPWFVVSQEAVRLEDGKTIIPDFSQIEASDFAIIFAVTGEGKATLVEQYKHGARRRIFELPAGMIEPGEDPLDAARRELREETGLEAETWRKLGEFVQDGNWGCGHCHAFLALNARQVAAPDSGDLQIQTLHALDLPSLRRLWLSNGLPTTSSAMVVGLALALLSEGG